MKRKFIFTIILWGMFLYVTQLIYVRFYPNRIPEAISLLESYKKNGTDIIYFGDSTLSYTSIKDKDRRPTPQLLDDLVSKDHSIGMVAYSAWNPTMYFSYSKYMSEKNYFPNYIIVPINLHNFSISSDLYPIYQFTDDLVYLQYYKTPLYPFLSFITNLVTADVNQKFSELYKSSMVYEGNNPIRQAQYYETMPDSLPYDTRFKNMVTFFYMASIKPDHRKLKSLVSLAKLYKNTKTKIIFYVTPLDYQAAEKYYPGKFKKRIASNVGLIYSRLKSEDAMIIDLSFSLKSNDFNWSESNGHKYIDEHINNHGKIVVSGELAKIIKKMDKKIF